MYKYIYPLIKWKIKPWLKHYIVKKGEGTPSEIITSASPITLANSLRRKFIKFIVGGNSIQDGEPSPTNECPIQNVTGNVEVKVENKNKYYSSTTGNRTINNVTLNYEKNSSEITINGTATATISDSFSIKPISLEAGTYTASIKGLNVISSNADRIFLKNNDTSNIIVNSIKDVTPQTFTLTETTNVVPVFIIASGSSYSNKIIQIQIEISSTATDYEPHEEQTAIFPLEEGQVLHETDTIKDKIVQRRKTIDLSTLTWNKATTTDSQGNTFGFYATLTERPKQDTTGVNFALCNILKQQKRSDVLIIDTEGFYLGSGATLYIKIKQSLIPSGTVAELNTLLTNTNATLEYELETPIEIPFTEAQRTAKAQIDSLHSYKGTTYISSSNEPGPIFEVQYYMEGE